MSKDNKPFGILNLDTLSALLSLTNTFTAKSRQPAGDFYFRSTASAGALYPNEIYVCAHDVEGLDPGTYHFDIFQRNLVVLRNISCLDSLENSLADTGKNALAATFFITAIFNRSAWKYRKRAYRYVLLDAGHVLQNLIFGLNAMHMPFSYTYDFSDHSINHLLGLDEQKETCLACVNITLPGISPNAAKNTDTLPDLFQPVQAASTTASVEMHYPEILDIHQSGALETANGLYAFENGDKPVSLGLHPENPRNIFHQKAVSADMPYPDALFARRSKRNFLPEDIPLEHLIHLLTLLDNQHSIDTERGTAYPRSMEVGFLANHVRDLESGYYLCNFGKHNYGMVEAGTFQNLMAAICLEQAWLKNANLHFLFMSNLEETDKYLGPRGYRYAMMEAGRLGQALYVGATALGLGCCGIGAMFDYEARQLLSLNESSFLLYLVAVGMTKT